MSLLPKTKKGWIRLFIIIVVIVVAISLYVYFSGKSNKNAPKTKGKKPVKKPTTPPPPGVPKWKPESFPLNVGMYGDYIRQLQAAVGVDQDGKLGPITKGAINAKGYNLPLSESDYNTIAIIGQPVYAYSDGILILSDDFSSSPTGSVKEGDFLGNIVSVSGTSYLINPRTSNPSITTNGNIYVQMSDVFFGDLQ